MGSGQLVLFRILPALALLCLGLGLIWRLYAYWRKPNPWRIPLTPGPQGLFEHLLHYVGDQFALPGFLQKRPWHWALWAATHLCLLLLALRHLRLVLNPVPDFMIWFMPLTGWVGYLLPALLILRLVRRMAMAQVAYASRLADYLVLLLLLAACLSGLYLRLLARADLWAAKSLFMGLWGFETAGLPWPGGAFTPHFVLGLCLIALLPLSPLNHFLVPLFNPIRRLRDTSRRQRHCNPWDVEHQADELQRGVSLPGEPPLNTILDYQLYLRARREE